MNDAPHRPSGNVLNFNHLHYFHVVAEEDGSLSSACARLAVTKPTVSAQLRRLEDALGVDLFDRAGGRLRLSDAGRAAFRYTTSMFTAGADLLKHFDAAREEPLARLRIGVVNAVTSAATAELFNPLLELERCQLELRHGGFPELRAMLLRSDLDLVLTDVAPADVESVGLQLTLLREEPLVLAGRADLVVSYRSLADALEQRPLLHYGHDAELYLVVERLLSALEIDPLVLARASHVSTLASLATGCDGVVLAPADALQPYFESGRLIELFRPAQAYSQTWAVVVERESRELIDRAITSLRRVS